jgi:ribosomal protein L15
MGRRERRKKKRETKRGRGDRGGRGRKGGREKLFSHSSWYRKKGTLLAMLWVFPHLPSRKLVLSWTPSFSTGFSS